jgi:hypothetical protein
VRAASDVSSVESSRCGVHHEHRRGVLRWGSSAQWEDEEWRDDINGEGEREQRRARRRKAVE